MIDIARQKREAEEAGEGAAAAPEVSPVEVDVGTVVRPQNPKTRRCRWW